MDYNRQSLSPNGLLVTPPSQDNEAKSSSTAAAEPSATVAVNVAANNADVGANVAANVPANFAINRDVSVSRSPSPDLDVICIGERPESEVASRERKIMTFLRLHPDAELSSIPRRLLAPLRETEEERSIRLARDDPTPIRHRTPPQ